MHKIGYFTHKNLSFIALLKDILKRQNHLTVLFFLITSLKKMSVNRHDIVMTFLDLLSEKKTTVYSLSLDCGIPRTTLTDIASGKADILECSGKTLLAISKSLNVFLLKNFYL